MIEEISYLNMKEKSNHHPSIHSFKIINLNKKKNRQSSNDGNLIKLRKNKNFGSFSMLLFKYERVGGSSS